MLLGFLSLVKKFIQSFRCCQMKCINRKQKATENKNTLLESGHVLKYKQRHKLLLMTRLQTFSLTAPCSDPGAPYQGNRIGNDFRHDHTVTFTCPRDYLMEGVPAIRCSNGKWSDKIPSCKGKWCLC